MITKTTLLSLAVAASTAAQTTTTATLLIPDWCVTQSQPSVTVLGSQSDLTTYSFSCTTDYSKISSAAAKASGLEESAKSKASALRASLGVPPEETDKPKPRGLLFNADSNEKRDSSYECYGWDAFDACIPWEITQGASYWAVKLSTTDVGGLYQTCTFGDGGVANGPATCTASGRLDPGIWGDGDGSHTETFAKTDVDEFYIRNTVPVTAGGGGIATGSGPGKLNSLEWLMLK